MAYTLTYGSLITQARNLIKSTCNNVDSNYSSIPAQYKSGWTQQTDNNALHVTASLSSNAVSQVAGSTVETDFNNFMNTCGISAISGNIITINGVLTFLNCLSSFCQARCVVYTSQYTTTNIIVYKTGTVTYPTVSYNGSNTEIITALDTNNMVDVLGLCMQNNMKCEATRYSRSVSWTGT